MSDGEDHVRIFDTTLRDGEQSPGASMTTKEKLEVAHALGRLGVDIIEAGFPAASKEDAAAVRAIAESVGIEGSAKVRNGKPPVVCGLARAQEKDIACAWDAIKGAARPRIHTFLATSEVHMRQKLRMSPQEVLKRVAEMVAYARSLCADIEFSAEDAGRTDTDFLHEVLEVAIAAGATTLNLPDTVGYTLPGEMAARVSGVREKVKGGKDVIISVHCHDDLGMATANTIAALRAGARQAEVTINGIGERAGNASLEEVVMAIRTRAGTLGLTTGIDSEQLTQTSRLVSARTGMVVPPNKAIVGDNAFSHESGIHQDGVLKDQTTYEIMRPESVGATGTRIVLGRHSGRRALGARLAALGFDKRGDDLDALFARFKVLAGRKKIIGDADLIALATEGGSREQTFAQQVHAPAQKAETREGTQQ